MNRRQFLTATIAAAAISAPGASSFAFPLPRLDIADPRIGHLNTGGVRVIGISPDGAKLIGTRDDGIVSILDAEVPWPLAESEEFPELPLLDDRSIRWSPDGTKIALSLYPWSAMRDSDIFLMDAETGHIENLTPEGTGDRSTDLLATDGDEVNIDTSPAWLDDNTLVFARHPFREGGELAVELMKLNIADGSIETWVDLTSAGVRFVLGPLWQRSDGSIVFEADLLVDGRPLRQAMVVEQDGALRVVRTRESDHVMVVDANDDFLIAHDPRTFEYLYVALDGDSEAQSLFERFAIPEGHSNTANPILGPRSDSILLITENEKNQTFLLLIDDAEATTVAELSESPAAVSLSLVRNVVLVAGREHAWTIELKVS